MAAIVLFCLALLVCIVLRANILYALLTGLVIFAQAWSAELAAVREAVDKIAGPYDNILVKSSVTVSQNISVAVTTDTADTDEAVENRVKAILTELLAVRRSRKLNELTLSDINHAIRSGYSGATNAAVSEPEADVKLGKDKVITLGDVSVTVERE